TVCRVVDVATGQKLAEVAEPEGFSWFDWHPDERVLALSTGGKHRIYLYDVATNRVVGPSFNGHNTDGILVRFNHAGDRLVSIDWDGTLRLWDVRTGRQLLARTAGGNCLQFSRDDRFLAADLSTPKVRLFRF